MVKSIHNLAQDKTQTQSPLTAPAASKRQRSKETMLKTLPSLFTLGNLISGFGAIFYASLHLIKTAQSNGSSHNELSIAAFLIFLGMIFDAFDGRIARLTGQTSEMGEQLDSMADMVTCGVAPAFLAYALIRSLVQFETPFFGSVEKIDQYLGRLTFVIAAIYVSCTALRLARFNAEIQNPEEADHMSFKGLPSPGAAGTISSLVILHQHLQKGASVGLEKTIAITMIAITLLTAFAMVSNIRYTHFVNKFISGNKPIQSIAIVLAVLGSLAVFFSWTLAIACIFYACYAPAAALYRRAFKSP